MNVEGQAVDLTEFGTVQSYCPSAWWVQGTVIFGTLSGAVLMFSKYDNGVEYWKTIADVAPDSRQTYPEGEKYVLLYHPGK